MTTNKARSLRRSQTHAEAVLWQRLRANQIGAKFRRQHPFGPYVLDFYCERAHLIIEVDGGQHFELAVEERDATRTRYLESAGLHVLRFTNLEVLLETASVLDAIWVATKAYNPSP